jgi:hypothetical protein
MMSNCEDGSHQITPATLIMEPVINFVPGGRTSLSGSTRPKRLIPQGAIIPSRRINPVSSTLTPRAIRLTRCLMS